jgi:2-polyprenyl-3-methyl-5-hydroxy-6-metoxy-1,4-benzoquinol methylase
VNATGLLAIVRNRANRAAVYSSAAYWDAKALDCSGSAVSMWPNEALNARYHREQLSLLREKLGPVRGKRILDVGCGTGRIARHLADQGAEVVGIDFAIRAIAIAARTSPAGNPSYRVQSMFDLDEAASFDVVVSWGSVAVACKDRRELHQALAGMRRALKPGGVILLLEPIHRGFLHRVLDMDTSEFVETMQAAGFRVSSITQLHFWPVRLALAFIPWPRPVTAAGYQVGQWIMRCILRNRAGGDYRGIHATVPVDMTDG